MTSMENSCDFLVVHKIRPNGGIEKNVKKMSVFLVFTLQNLLFFINLFCGTGLFL